MGALPEQIRTPDGRDPRLGDLALPRFSDKTYHGERTPGGGCVVWCDETQKAATPAALASYISRRPLPRCVQFRIPSPTGFEWGYGSSGPAQLALALLVDALEDAELAQAHYHELKFAVVAGWDDAWKISDGQIQAFASERTKA